MLSAPLLMSNDLRIISDEYKQILLNRHVIDVDQDPAGRMARAVININNSQTVWVKQLSQPEGSFAIVYFYRAILGSSKYVSVHILKLHQHIPSLTHSLTHTVCSSVCVCLPL